MILLLPIGLGTFCLLVVAEGVLEFVEFERERRAQRAPKRWRWPKIYGLALSGLVLAYFILAATQGHW